MKTLTITLLGPFEARVDDEPAARFEYAKVRALLAYLAVESQRPSPRGQLAELLWPEQPERAARGSLSQALTTLRHALGDKGRDQPLVVADAQAVQLDPACGLAVDVAQFLARLQESEAHGHRSWRTCTACAERLCQAMTLYRGPFLADVMIVDSAPFEQWAALQREHLLQRALSALERLVQWCEWRGRYVEAIAYARHQVALEPLLEENQRGLMRLLALNGETAAAVVQFNQLKRVLADELGAEPEAATTALLDQLRRGQTGRLPHRSAPFFVPGPPAQLVGRAQELQTVCARLRDEAARLLTITGTGGIGKTRLALEAAHALRYDFEDGAFFVDLAPLTDAALVPDALASALNLAARAGQDILETLRSHLRTRHTLLILDNFEHILPAASVVAELLAASPWLKVIATSRQPLQIRAEQVFWLDPLPNAAAIQLFIERAQAVGAVLAAGEENTKVYSAICQGLDGLPLAIELIAARARLLPPIELLRQVAQPLQSLDSGPRDAPTRQQTLRNALQWSYDLLNAEEQRVFTQIGVFAGGCDLEAAQAVLGETRSVLPVLEALQRASLLQQQTAVDAVRFAMLDTVRAFALEQAAARDQLQGASERHAHYFVELAETAEREFLGPGQAIWLGRVAADYDNLRHALDWCRQNAPIVGLRIAAALERYYESRGNRREGLAWLKSLLDLAAQAPPALRAKALRISGMHAVRLGQYPAAAAALTESLHIFERLGSYPGEVARVHNILGNVAYDQDQVAVALAEYQVALDLRRQLGDRWGLASVLNNLALCYHVQGEWALAEATFDESLRLYRETGDAQSAASTLGNMGELALTRQQPLRAQELFFESLQIRTEIDDRVGQADVLNGLGRIALLLNDFADAHRRFVDALKRLVELDDYDGQAASLAGLAGVAQASRDPERAARLLGAIQALGYAGQAVSRTDIRQAIAAVTQSVRGQLRPERFQAEWAKGLELTPEQVINLALDQPHGLE